MANPNISSYIGLNYAHCLDCFIMLIAMKQWSVQTDPFTISTYIDVNLKTHRQNKLPDLQRTDLTLTYLIQWSQHIVEGLNPWIGERDTRRPKTRLLQTNHIHVWRRRRTV